MPHSWRPPAGGPWCFSLSGCFLLTLRILGHSKRPLMLTRGLQCQPPSSNFYSLCGCFFSPLMFKRNVSSPHNTNPSLANWLQMLPSESEEQFICLAIVIVSWLHLGRLSPHASACLTCWPTAFFPSVNPFLLLIHQPAEMRLQRGKIVRIPVSSMAVGRFIILIVWSRADWQRECFLSDQKPTLEI